MTDTPIYKLITHTSQAGLWWQAGVIGASILFAWLILYIFRKRPMPGVSGSSDNAKGVLLPVIALLLLLVGKALLARWQNVSLLNIAIPLLISFVLVQIAVYVLRRLFAPATWLSGYEHLIATIIWLGLALHVTGFLPEILEIMDDLSFSIGRHRVSLLLIGQGLLAIAITLLAAMWLGRIIASRVMNAEGLDHNLRMLAAKFIRAVLLFAGILIALPLAGIDITVLSVFGGALGVGLGFGLQKVASNYISGFIILLDHSIHIGDVVMVDNRYGTVSRLTARYMVLRGPDGTESLIPNETLITSTVVNHSYSDRKVRLLLPVQISYESSLEDARRVLLEAASSHPLTLPEPPPQVLVHDLNNNGIRLELSLWALDPGDSLGALRSDINQQVWEKFRSLGIEIPYVHHDIRIIRTPPKHGSV